MMLKSCTVISVQNNFQVLGLRLKAVKHGKYFIENQFAGTYTENDGLGEVLSLALESLNTSGCDRVVIAGGIEGCGVFEIRMPELSPEELKQAVEYELPKYVPLSLSDIVWSARVLPGEDTDGHIGRVRIIFMLRDKWEKFISELQIRGLKVDAIVNPFMSIDPFAAGENIVLPMIDDEHVFLSGDDGLREMNYAENIVQNEEQKKQLLDYFVWDEEENIEEYFVCMLVAKYVMSGEYDKYEKKLALELPQSLIPQRNKFLKWCALG